QVFQLVQERSGIFQICCVETLSEPAVNWFQEGTGLYGSAFVVPMLGEAGGGAQLPPTGLLLPRNRQCPPQSSFRLSFLAQAQQHLAPQGMHFSFKKPLVCYFCCLNCLVEQIEANLRLSEARVGRGEMAKIQRAAVPLSAAFGRRNGVAHQLDPVLRIAALGEQGPPKETCPVSWTRKSVFDAEGYRFISVGCGPLWITTNGAEERHVAQS